MTTTGTHNMCNLYPIKALGSIFPMVVHPGYISLLVNPIAVYASMKSLQAYTMAGYTNDITASFM